MATITFHELVSVPWFRQRRLMKTVLRELFHDERVPLGSVDYILCSDEYLLQINQQFLQHDDFTDIITFDLTPSSKQAPYKGAYSKELTSKESSSKDASPKVGDPKQGEIYISVDRVVENAATLGLPRDEELRRVMFHGCLHLCGYKDKLNEQRAVMRKMEDKYLRLYKRRST